MDSLWIALELLMALQVGCPRLQEFILHRKKDKAVIGCWQNGAPRISQVARWNYIMRAECLQPSPGNQPYDSVAMRFLHLQQLSEVS